MITGATRGSGGPGLAAYWGKQENVEVVLLAARDIAAETLPEQVSELTCGTMHAFFRQPIWHIHIAPSPGDRRPTNAELADLWRRIEQEFNLWDQPYVGVRHVHPRVIDVDMRHPSWQNEDYHEHRAYSLAGVDGHMVDTLAHDYVRRERVVAGWELDNGFTLTPFKHERAILAWAVEHRPDLATALQAAGMSGQGATRVAAVSSRDRQRLERAGVRDVVRYMNAVRRDVLGAWLQTTTAAEFRAVLGGRAYRLAAGSTAIMIVDPAGVEHSLVALLVAASVADDAVRIAPLEVKRRLAGAMLPALKDVRLKSKKSAEEEDEGRHEWGEGGGKGNGSGETVAAKFDRDSDRGGQTAGPGGTGRGAITSRNDCGSVDGDRREPGAPGAETGRPAAIPDDGIKRYPVMAPMSPRRRLGERRLSEALRPIDFSPMLELAAALRMPPRPPGRMVIPEAERHRRDLLARPALLELAVWRITAESVDEDSAARFVSAVGSKTYQPAVPDALVDEIILKPNLDQVRVRLLSGGYLVEEIQSIRLHGAINSFTPEQILSLVVARGWTIVSLFGPDGFKNTMTVKMALTDPPVEVVNHILPLEIESRVAAFIARRNEFGSTQLGPTW